MHRFILILSLCSCLGTLLLSLLINISQNSIMVGVVWFVLLTAVTLFYWSKSRITSWVVSLPSMAGIWLSCNLISRFVSSNILSVGTMILGGLIFSGSLFAMILGHWYLNVVNLPIHLLRNATRLIIIFLIIRFLWNANSIINESVSYDGILLPITEFLGTMEGIFLWTAILFGIILPLLLGYLTLRTVAIHSTQSATGLLYVLVISVVMGDLFFKYYAIRYGLVL